MNLITIQCCICGQKICEAQGIVMDLGAKLQAVCSNCSVDREIIVVMNQEATDLNQKFHDIVKDL